MDNNSKPALWLIATLTKGSRHRLETWERWLVGNQDSLASFGIGL